MLLHERLEHAAQHARRTHSRTAVLFADIDQFKEVNDTFGHHVGDALLIAFAGRLSTLVRAGDTLARFSGDEFVLLCENIRDDADAVQLSDRISESLAQPLEFDGNKIAVTASVGIAYAGPGDDVTGQLLIDADHAMYQAKRRRSPRSRSVTTGRGDVADYVLENELTAALGADELTVVYQPVVGVPSRQIEAVEALLRWDHPTRGPIDPQTVITIAERGGLINELGTWVLDHACRDHARWTQRNPTVALDLSVNLSATQLATAGLAEAIETVLTLTCMDPSKLVLEITETVLIDDSISSTTALTELDALGIRLALDDFGSGYSSLSYLDQLPIRIIKIDQQFVSRLSRPDDSTIVICGIVDIAQQLGLIVVAEGVETRVQHDHIVSIGCDSAQGLYYARPFDSDELDAYLMAGRTGAVPGVRSVGHAAAARCVPESA